MIKVAKIILPALFTISNDVFTGNVPTIMKEYLYNLYIHYAFKKATCMQHKREQVNLFFSPIVVYSKGQLI